jgi:hypothetical protein
MEIKSMIIIGIVVVIVLFFIFRELNCWYWKINDRVKLAEEQNMLLEKILQYTIGATQISQTNNPNAIITEKDGKAQPENIIYNSLSVNEKNEVAKFMSYGLNKGDKLVINKTSRNIDRFDEKEWGEIIKKYQQNEWLIIFEK